MSKWLQIYENQIAGFESLDAFIKSRITYKKKLLLIIEKYASRTKKILEVGCGSGITSVFLGTKGYRVVAIDSDSEMVEFAKSIAKRQHSSAIFNTDDIRILETIHDHFDVIFSNGVMEHFSDNEIVSIVNKHLSRADYVVVSIPSDYFSEDQKIFGDERFMNVNQWKNILSKTKGYIVEEFNFESNKVITNKPQFIGFVLSSL